MIRRLGISYVVAISVAFASGTGSIAQAPARPVTANAQCVNQNERQAAIGDLVARINAAVRALPPERSSAEDIEAAIVYTISQRNLCPCVAAEALAMMVNVQAPNFRKAVANARTSMLDCQASGTAGISGGAFTGPGASFSPPLNGVGGGSATYSQQ